MINDNADSAPIQGEQDLEELCATIETLMPGAVEAHQLRTKGVTYVRDYLAGTREALAEAEAIARRQRNARKATR